MKHGKSTGALSNNNDADGKLKHGYSVGALSAPLEADTQIMNHSQSLSTSALNALTRGKCKWGK